jgi:hypothetical protein
MFRIVVHTPTLQRDPSNQSFGKMLAPKTITLRMGFCYDTASLPKGPQYGFQQFTSTATAASLFLRNEHGFFANPGVFAEELMRTPSWKEGPFYPDKLPLDQDNDLIVIRDGSSKNGWKLILQNTNSMGTRR